MENFKSALISFLRGELDVGSLERELLAVLKQYPGIGQKILMMLDKPYKAGRLPEHIYQMIKQRIETFDQQQSQAPADNADKTRVGGMPPSPPQDNADKTRVGGMPPPPPQDNADKTRVGGMPPPVESSTTGFPAQDQTGEYPADDDKTFISSDSPNTTGGVKIDLSSSTTGGSTTGRSTTGQSTTGQSTTGQSTTGQTGGVTSGFTGRTDSSWGDPNDWSEDNEILGIGSTIKGRFVLESILGQGGMGTVYKARDLRKEEAQDRNPFVAVKVLNEDFKRHPESLKALQRESRKSQNLAHPNIVTVYDFDRDGSNVYMTMEYLDGRPLDETIKENVGLGMSEEEAWPIILSLCHALSYAHEKNIVHSDFKPSNAFLTRSGAVKVFDFGIARASKQGDAGEGEQTLFDAGSLGALTPAYASYEMLMGEEPDARDDIYALACVAYELMMGKHPFNKVPAHKAKDQKLVPEPVKYLSKSQWKGLLKGLAFERSKRSPTVDDFLDGLQRKKINKSLLVGAAAVVSLLAIGLAIFVPDYLNKRHLKSIVDDFKTGDDNKIVAALDELGKLEAEEKSEVARTAREDIQDYFLKRINNHFDASKERYDFPGALVVLNKVKALYPDSRIIGDKEESLLNDKKVLLSQLDERFNLVLGQGYLLPVEGRDDLTKVLSILAKVEPKSSLLQDPRLPVAYARQTEIEVNSKNYDKAEAYLEVAIARFPNESTFINLRDRINTGKERHAQALTIAKLQKNLTAALPGLKTLSDFDNVQFDLLDLKEARSNDPLVIKIQTWLQAKVAGEVKRLVKERSWDSAESTLKEYISFVDKGFYQKKDNEIKVALKRHQNNIAGIFTAINKATTSRRLGGTGKNSALVLLQKLKDSDASQDLIDQANAGIAQEYLQLARESRANAKWDQARKYVQLGLKQKPGDATLLGENIEISNTEESHKLQLAEGERIKLEQKRQARIKALREGFNEGLEKDKVSTADAKRMMDTLNKLASVNPTDPLISNGRGKLADRLIVEANTMSSAGRWGEALNFSRDILKIIPESQTLVMNLSSLEQGYKKHLSDADAQKIAAIKREIDTMINSPKTSRKWEKDVSVKIKSLSKLSADNVFISSANDRIALFYLDRAKQMRKGQRFSEASSFIERGQKFSAGLKEIEAEKQVLANEEGQFKEANKEKARLAELEGLKKTLLTQANANDVRKAKKAFASLQSKLSADDKFLTKTGPQAIAKAYLRLAEGKARRNRYSDAIQMAKNGLEVAQIQALTDAIERYQKASKVYTVKKELRGGFDARDVKEDLLAIKKQDPKAYPGIEKELASLLIGRITKLQKKDYAAAARLLASSQRVFPKNIKLAKMVIKKPVVVKRPPPVVVKSPPPPVVVTPPPKRPIVVSGKKDRCQPRIAGYGKKLGRGTCYDALPDSSKGPLLVVVPSGGEFSSPFAITKYEISIDDFNRFCRTSGSCSPKPGNGKLPVTDVSYRQAQIYAQWLSAESGFTYRIPTDSEWVYAANAAGKQPDRDFNCRAILQGKILKGHSLTSVKLGKQNGWGLLNYIGNAQEWIATSSGAVVRGGAYVDPLSDCSIDLKKSHSGKADNLTGIRLVREMKGSS